MHDYSVIVERRAPKKLTQRLLQIGVDYGLASVPIIYGALQVLPEVIQTVQDSSSGDSLVDYSVGAAKCLGVAALTYLSGKSFVRNVMRRREKLPEEKRIFPPGFFHEIGNAVAKREGIEGELAHVNIELLTDAGTAHLRGGYVFEAKLFYEGPSEEREIGLIIKNNRKPEIRVVNKFLRGITEAGACFIPYVVEPEGLLYKLMVGDAYGEDITGLPRGPPLVSRMVTHPLLSLETITGKKAETVDTVAISRFYEDANIRRVFENLFAIYDSPVEVALSPEEKRLNEKQLEETLARAKEEAKPFLQENARIIGDIEEQLPKRPLTHNDLHQGNLFFNPDADFHFYVGDWDNARFGIPFFDFAFFHTITDFEKAATFEEERAWFAERQRKVYPAIGEDTLEYMSFLAHKKLLRIYAPANVPEETKQGVLLASRYLLEKSKETLRRYATITGNDAIVGKYERYLQAQPFFEEVMSVDFNPLASVGFAHEAYKRRKKAGEGEVVGRLEREMADHIGKLEAKIASADDPTTLTLGIESWKKSLKEVQLKRKLTPVLRLDCENAEAGVRKRVKVAGQAIGLAGSAIVVGGVNPLLIGPWLLASVGLKKGLENFVNRA